MARGKMSSVTIVIPCYNAAKYVNRTIDSALSQTGVDFEIIAVDDGSADNTLSVISAYEPRIKVLTHQDNVNLGQAASLNLAIDNSQAEFIAFLDSDDVFYQGKLEKQIDIFNKNPEVGLVYTGGHVIDDNDNILYGLFSDDFIETNTIGAILLNCYIRTPSSVMVRRDVLQKAGRFTAGITVPDHDMWIRMSEITKFHHLPDALTGYRQRAGQVSSKRRLWEDGFIVLDNSINRFSYGPALRSKRLAVLHYRLGEHDRYSKRYISSVYNFLMAVRYDPLRAFKSCLNAITIFNL